MGQEGCSCQWSEQASEVTGCVSECVCVRVRRDCRATGDLGGGRCLGCVATQARTCWLGLPQLGQVGFGLAGFGGEIFRVDWWNGRAIVAGLPGLVWAARLSGCCGTAD